MTQRSVVVALFGFTVLTSHVLQGPAASAGAKTRGPRCGPGRHREVPPAGHCRHVVARSCCAEDLWTDDAIRLGAGAPAEVGKKAIREGNERLTANKGFKVLRDVPETKDFTFLDGGWAVEWRTFTASYVDAAGGEAKQIRGTVLWVLKKLPDGSWKCFRLMGGTGQVLPAKPVACDVNQAPSSRPERAGSPRGLN